MSRRQKDWKRIIHSSANRDPRLAEGKGTRVMMHNSVELLAVVVVGAAAFSSAVEAARSIRLSVSGSMKRPAARHDSRIVPVRVIGVKIQRCFSSRQQKHCLIDVHVLNHITANKPMKVSFSTPSS